MKLFLFPESSKLGNIRMKMRSLRVTTEAYQV
jgi:hypothetical protein